MPVLTKPIAGVSVPFVFECGGPRACGGGCGMSFNYLDEHVLNHGYTFTAEEDLDRMRYGGVRGASKGLIPFLAIRGV